MLIRARASRSLRWQLSLAAGVLILAQLAAVSHLIGHTAAGENSGCAICLAAGAAGTTLPASDLTQVFVPSTATLAVEPATALVPTRLVARYRARAPPVST